MSTDNDQTPNTELDNLPIPDELTALKTRADLLGIKYHPSIGLETLREKVNGAVSAATKEPETKPTESATAVETEGQIRNRKRREAAELVRIRVVCMNPAKKEWEGEIFTCGNALVGTHKKYVPFGVDAGWHVPRIIYNQIVERQCQIFTSTRDSRGNQIRQGKMIREFAVEVLPNLTPEELKDLAQQQAMAKSIG